MEIRKKATAQTQKKLTMWNIEFPVAKINDFPHHKLRTMHEIKMGIEFDAGEEEKNVCVYVWWFDIDRTIFNRSDGKWHTIYVQQKPHTFNLFTCLFVTAQQFVYGIWNLNLQIRKSKRRKKK